MPTGTLNIGFTMGGCTPIQKAINREGDHPNPYEVVIGKAKAATAWVKTDANTAACNLTAGHGVVTGKVDVYWTGGKRLGVDATVTVNAIALDGGAGDDFPASADATVRLMNPVQINTAIDGDAIVIIVCAIEVADKNAVDGAYIEFRDAAADVIATMTNAVNQPDVCDVEGGATNKYTGDPIAVAYASHGNVTYDATCKIYSLEDSTP